MTQQLNKIKLHEVINLDNETLAQRISSIDVFNSIVNSPPLSKWIKTHKYIKGCKYLPISTVEWLLRKIFKDVRIEILREGSAFNGVFVVVRVHYLHPVLGEIVFQDGIGASGLQTEKGSGDGSFKSGALSMAFPIAKSYAVKDACHQIGKIFGSDLNRQESMEHSIDENLYESAFQVKDQARYSAFQRRVLDLMKMSIEADMDRLEFNEKYRESVKQADHEDVTALFNTYLGV